MARIVRAIIVNLAGHFPVHPALPVSGSPRISLSQFLCPESRRNSKEFTPALVFSVYSDWINSVMLDRSIANFLVPIVSPLTDIGFQTAEIKIYCGYC